MNALQSSAFPAEAKEVQIKWIECEDLDGMDADQIYLLLKESQDAFSVQ